MEGQSLLNSRYQIEDRIGSGGMAEVYRARDLMLERTVAIKILREDLSSSSAFRERFHQEAKSVAKLSHPSIITIHDFGFDHDKLFLVMEYVPGTDLKAVLEKHGPFTLEEALPLLIQACAGLGYAHRAGLIHCDVKPHNMIVTPDAQLKIADFGIARALSTVQTNYQPNVVWGSPQYFSPEQAAGQVLTPASDIYSLGVVMYEMLTGHLPFEASTASELSLLHRTATPPSPRRWNAQISPAIEAIIFKVLSKEPSTRYRNGDQFGRVLMVAQQSSQLPTSAHTPVQRPSQPQPAVMLTKPANATPSHAPEAAAPTTNGTRPSSLDIDWITWALVIGALVAVGGLIPLWLWVYLLYFPKSP